MFVVCVCGGCEYVWNVCVCVWGVCVVCVCGCGVCARGVCVSVSVCGACVFLFITQHAPLHSNITCFT